MTHSFDSLLSHYPSVIGQMPERFTAHQFILKLAEQNQRLYVEALYAYRDDAPFQKVHKRLAELLRSCPDVERDGDEPHSRDIWTNPQACSRWRKKSR